MGRREVEEALSESLPSDVVLGTLFASLCMVAGRGDNGARQKSSFFFCLGHGVVSSLLAAGRYMRGGPVPEGKKPPRERDWTAEGVDAAVSMSRARIYSPAPRDNGQPPPECDCIHFLPFRAWEASVDPPQRMSFW